MIPSRVFTTVVLASTALGAAIPDSHDNAPLPVNNVVRFVPIDTAGVPAFELSFLDIPLPREEPQEISGRELVKRIRPTNQCIIM